MTLDISWLMALEARDARRPAVDPRFSFRFLTADEVRAFSADPANELSGAFADRLSCGQDVCFAVLEGERLVGYSWLALESIEAEQNRGSQPHSALAISFGADTAFAYKGLTRPEFRGQHTHAASFTESLDALSQRGVVRLLLTTDWTNRAALACCRRAGFREVGLIWRFGWRGAMFTIVPRGAVPLGLRFGRAAQVHERRIAEGSDASGAWQEQALIEV